ncbi:ATP-binding SpoIIE family protein phosphatase [Paenibacillus sp. CF384]|uniref:ATP-binding SpoIIE family protein phosphatase n=1 Tax=Paenibacillus sp. CF384 TaxID=1884382 RepID=UPI000896D054|nr:ATP-binding SpoIIE family protein phosphatase [Paenibacillus sp. CF384]SDX29479.1 Serine phosphatase RsbU, regulator of sigma subunit [Paenibacillus sp. CF384]
MELMTTQNKNRPSYAGRSLLNRLLLIYVIALVLSLLILRAETILVAHFEAMFPFPFIVNVLGAVMLAVVLVCASAWRLQPVIKELQEDASSSTRTGIQRDNSLTSAALVRLYRMPYELLISVLLIGLLISASFHLVDLIQVWNEEEQGESIDWLQLTGIMAGEQSLIMTVALVLFTSVRRLFRPYMMKLQPLSGSFDGRASFSQPLVITYTCTFLVTILSLFQLAIVTARPHESMEPYKFGLIALFYFLIGLSLFSYVTMQFRQELRGLIRDIRGLVGGTDIRNAHTPSIVHDEAGELAVAYSELQNRINREYESLERELKMAYNVQQKLLPPGNLTIGAYHITSRCRSYREVGGDFFDVVSLGPSRFAVMIGDVSGKGLPAALIMSAQLLVFRSEIRRNGSPSEVLARMNRQLCEAMGDEGCVSIGVGVIDLTNNKVQYASAGHLSPYIISKDGQFAAIDCSSLPIGIDPEAVYEEKDLQLKDGDRFLLYTDGLIEAVDHTGNMYSFEGLEAEIATWASEGDLSVVVDEWLARVDEACGPGQDDRTVVVLELAGEYRSALDKLDLPRGDYGDVAAAFDNPFMTREWTLRSKLGEERLIALKLGDWMQERWPESVIKEDVQSAVCEAMINAIEHGNKLQPNTYVTVIAQIGGMLSVCRIYDEGGGYYPRLSRDEAEMRKKLESEDPRGWGLVMIDTLADYWTTGRDERGFYTELYFMRKLQTASGG